MAQLAAHLSCKQVVRGSSPLAGSTPLSAYANAHIRRSEDVPTWPFVQAVVAQPRECVDSRTPPGAGSSRRPVPLDQGGGQWTRRATQASSRVRSVTVMASTAGPGFSRRVSRQVATIDGGSAAVAAAATGAHPAGGKTDSQAPLAGCPVGAAVGPLGLERVDEDQQREGREDGDVTQADAPRCESDSVEGPQETAEQGVGELAPRGRGVREHTHSPICRPADLALRACDELEATRMCAFAYATRRPRPSPPGVSGCAASAGRVRVTVCP